MDKMNVDLNLIHSYEQMEKNYFLVNEECLKDFWSIGEEILSGIREYK